VNGQPEVQETCRCYEREGADRSRQQRRNTSVSSGGRHSQTFGALAGNMTYCARGSSARTCGDFGHGATSGNTGAKCLAQRIDHRMDGHLGKYTEYQRASEPGMSQ
jgi:hypothetical protein